MLKSVLLELLRNYRRERKLARDNAVRVVQSEVPARIQKAMNPAWHVFGDVASIQTPFDVAVIMPTVGRATILDAVNSVFAQSARSIRIQLLIGVDAVQDDLSKLFDVLERSPPHITTCLFYPGYSTSVRHGGLHPARDGGTLRSTLTYVANARYVAYLDDDNWWHEDHVQRMISAIHQKDWAFSLRWFVHPDTRQAICEDTWESVGPGKGVFFDKFGGWVDPNCLMFDKLACEPVVRWWSIPLPGDVKAMSADRHVFDFLRRQSEPGHTGVPTVYYALDPNDGMHPSRLEVMGREAYEEAGGRVPAARFRAPQRPS